MEYPLPPDKLFGELFSDVQRGGIFHDSKSFADAVPLIAVDDINREYLKLKDEPDFDLSHFVFDRFTILTESETVIKDEKDIKKHLNNLWSLLTRVPSYPENGSSLLYLPYPYIVPGGRFREIYYWDSYFTMLGLIRSGKMDMVVNMVRNFKSLIETFGHIPNGNRTYYLSRSQPPFYVFMVELLMGYQKQDAVFSEFLPSVLQEYHFWMEGADLLTIEAPESKRAVLMPEGEILNRYWDEYPHPRQESYTEDEAMSHNYGGDVSDLYRNVRAACESGWDFSSRWLEHPDRLETIQTTKIIPVDLNVLLWKYEDFLSNAYGCIGNDGKVLEFRQKANQRKSAILKYCWSQESLCFIDYHFTERSHCKTKSLAMLYPLWMGLATSEQAKAVAGLVENQFLFSGGLVTTPEETGQQWDAPNGWAPLQWIAAEALAKYGYIALSDTIKSRWCVTVERVFKHTGKMMEKYNVVDTSLEAGGGEYPVQDGFGWTNGVYLSFKNSLDS